MLIKCCRRTIENSNSIVEKKDSPFDRVLAVICRCARVESYLSFISIVKKNKTIMKKLILPTIVLLVALFFSSCEKCMVDDCEFIPAKVIRYDCDRVIFQLLTEERIGDSQWEDKRTGERYSNVVSYYNTCRIGALTNNCEIDTLYVKVKKTTAHLTNGNCIQCQAISDSPPQTRVDFVDISITACAAPAKE